MALISSSFLLKLLGTIICISIGLYAYFKLVLYTYWRKKGIPYLEPCVPFGNFLNLVRRKCHFGETFAYAYEKMKENKVFGMYTFHKPCLVIADHDLIRYVLTKEFSSFHDRGLYYNDKVDPLSGHLFFMPGKKWRTLRAKLSPAITPGRMKMMFGYLRDRGVILNKLLKDKAEKNSIVEIHEILARFTTDIIMTTVFGVECNTLLNIDREYRYWGKQVFESHNIKNAIGFFAPQILDFFSIPFTNVGVQKFFLTVFKEAVKHRVNNNVNNQDFMDLIIQLMKKGYVTDVDGKSTQQTTPESSNSILTMEEGAAQAFVFFLAGFETSSSTAAHCLYELSIHQDMQEEVRKEIFSQLGENDDLTFDNLNEMPYLHKVVCETLRKYPVVPLLNRVCTKDINLLDTDITVKKGTDIVIPVLGIHMNPDIYPEPMKFDPERFNEKNTSSRHPYAYLPFGEGPRICIGMRFGLVQVKVAIINTLRHCRISLGTDTQVPLPMDPGKLSYASKDGIYLRMELL